MYSNPTIPNGVGINPLRWNPKDIFDFLKVNQGEWLLNDEDIEIIKRNRLAGSDFLIMTTEDLCEHPYNLVDGAARRMEQLINALENSHGTFLPTTTKVLCSLYLPIMPPEPFHSRQQRWDEFNTVLEKVKNEKGPTPDSGEAPSETTVYNCISWSDVSFIFDNICRPYVEHIKEIPESDYKTLSKLLNWIVKCYHANLFDGKENEAKRLHLIAPVLWSVVQLLPDVTVKIEADIKGKRVHAHAYLGFVLTCGGKCVCILEAKEEKFTQGMAHNLLGCEVGVANADLVRDYVANIYWGLFNGR